MTSAVLGSVIGLNIMENLVLSGAIWTKTISSGPGFEKIRYLNITSNSMKFYILLNF